MGKRAKPDLWTGCQVWMILVPVGIVLGAYFPVLLIPVSVGLVLAYFVLYVGFLITACRSRSSGKGRGVWDDVGEDHDA